MFYCDKCRDSNEWPDTLSKSDGPCECCGKKRLCNDIPIKDLPTQERPTMCKHIQLPLIAIQAKDVNEEYYIIYDQPVFEDCNMVAGVRDKKHAEYIVKACNAYPKLVKFVKRCMDTDYHECRKDREQLLEGLGEIE